MLANHSREKSPCLHCKESLLFDKPHMRSYDNLAKGKKKVQADILRCPECKRIANFGIPIIDLRREI